MFHINIAKKRRWKNKICVTTFLSDLDGAGGFDLLAVFDPLSHYAV